MNRPDITDARIILLATPRSYRLDSFRAAAARIGVSITTAVDMPDELANQSALVGRLPATLALPFGDSAAAVRRIVNFAADYPVSAILAVDDSGSLIAAAASDALGLAHNSPDAAEAARDKYVMRRMLEAGGVAVPWFRRFSTADDAAAIAGRVAYPCVVKPLNLNGSRGVIRADSPEELVQAIARLSRMLSSSAEERSILVEGYLPGFEVALEGILDNGKLQVLALFDKPDPLEGPFFEETIYVTPSRLPAGTQNTIAEVAARAARALGLSIGPVHAEMRVDGDDVWMLELAGRSIGGLCSKVLRFGVDVSLEELILRQVMGLPLGNMARSGRAAGVMMIPIPEAGLLRGIDGVAEAEKVPLIEGVEITARLNYPLVPLPEGDSYLGFIFARGDTPEAVEAALRQAHSHLRFVIDPLLALYPSSSKDSGSSTSCFTLTKN